MSTFIWTDELVSELIYQKLALPEYYFGNTRKMIEEFKSSKSKPQADNKELYTMRWNGEDYLLDKNATFVGKPAFLMSEKGMCTKSWVSQLNSTSHWMCDPIGIVASSNKLLGLPSVEEYAKKPKVLFTTEDGVEITDGSIFVYGVNERFDAAWAYSANSLASADKWWWFSTGEKAREYIKQNKPLNISMKEIVSCVTEYVYGPPHCNPRSATCIDFDKLDALINSKFK